MENQTITTFFENPIFLTWIGALCGHFLAIYSDSFKGTTPFLMKLIPNKKETFYVRCDFIILPIIGCILAMALLEPTNVKNSVMAGLTWSGTLVALLNNKMSNKNE